MEFSRCERHRRSVLGRVCDRPEPEARKGARLEHEQAYRRERCQGSGDERPAGGEPPARVIARVGQNVKDGEEREGRAALLDDEGRAEEHAAGEESRNTAPIAGGQQDEHPRQGWR